MLPLEEKVKEYLSVEEEIRKATLHAGLVSGGPTATADSSGQHEQVTQRLQAMREDLSALHAELLAMLPTRDEWVKVNLGYGPSRVGAWHVPATDATPEHYQVRVVH
ncbi:hypothetical protein [Hymenobacter saemangeumensis]|uniref:hypothetical protein n=1 Tax=Hymenobacter saemangeumensis TaxID=1084522 RepID=UPI0031E8F73B